MKTLLLDIETRPTMAYTWDLFNVTINIEQIIEPSSPLCFAAKWYGEKDTIYYSAQHGHFRTMIRAAHKLLNEADAIITFNGDSFDIPILNREFLALNLPPPAPSASIDLYRVIRNKFKMVSNKLAFVGPYLKIGDKVKHEGFPLWVGCMKGDVDCWRRMEVYNRQDVNLMVPLYQRLLPWIDKHPNISMFEPIENEKPTCPNCGSDKLRSAGLRRATTYTYRRLQCLACGKWMRERMSLKAAAKPKVTSI